MIPLRIDQLTPITSSTNSDVIPVVPYGTSVAQIITLGQIQSYIMGHAISGSLPQLPYFADDISAANALPLGSLYRLTGSKVVSQV